MSTVLGTPTFDAQMSDYSAQGDLDVLMQAHSTDPWTAQDDGIMEEDSSFSMLTAKNPDSATVGMFMPATTEGTDHQNEVEMEDYEHHSEYEMLDESEAIVEDHDHSTGTIQEEIVDVEVVDLQPSPETSLTMAAPPALEPRVDEATVPQHLHSPLPLPPLDIAPEAPRDVLPADPAGVTMEHTTVESAISETALPVEGHTHDAETAATEATASDHPTHVPHDSGAEVDHPKPHHQEPPFTEADADASSTIGVAPSEHAILEHPTTSEQHYEAEPPIDESDVGDHVEVGSNPHEIADGVFIEPVPPVIVQASFSHQPLVLFNRPPASRPHSPSPDDDVPPDTMVLLHDRPTLYYGPLSDLFTALREEELVAQQPDIHHAELGFSVESLELSITEDNIHAKEFSLFQLNNLHDSFHAGSLRVTLFQQAPRFIARYHELQEHLNRLGVNPSEDTILTAAPSSTGEGIAEQREISEHEAHAAVDQTEAAQQQESAMTRHEQDTHAEETDPQHHAHEEQQEEPRAAQADSENERPAHDVVESLSRDHEEHTEAAAASHANEQHGVHAEEPQADVSEVVHVEDTRTAAAGEESEASHLEPLLDSNQEGVDRPNRNVDLFEQVVEVVGGVTEVGEAEADYPSVDGEPEAPSDEEGVVEEDDASSEVDVHEYEGDEQDGTEQLNGEYNFEDDPDQAEADELQEDLEAGEDSEHSGDVTYEDDTDTVAQENDQQGEYADERSPSPGAEDELPPIDTNLLQAVDADNAGDFSTSASTQEDWLAEGYDLVTEEVQDTETLRSNSEEGNEDADNYVDDHSLAHHEGEGAEAEWDQDADAEADPSWDGEYDGFEEQPVDDSAPNVRPKRGFHEVDDDEEEVHELGSTPSPGSKRSRLG